MQIQHDISLKTLNTFGVDVTARYYARAASVDDVRCALAWAGENRVPVIVLGGGSNILFTRDPDALVLHVALRGITERALEGGKRLVTAAAGESWPDLVWWAVERGYGGIENLSMIPGTLGAAPVQNIGAYGAEFRDVCAGVTALNCKSGGSGGNGGSGAIREFSPEECRFGYRDSIFKREAGEWIVLAASMLLDPAAPLHTGYGALREKLEAAASSGAALPTYADVARAVADIRTEKLPAPENLGSAGSFFKNPVVSVDAYRKLCDTYPELPGFEQGGMVKLSAAWLLDRAGWKGKRRGDAGCYAMQPLVLVNYGRASGDELLRFSLAVQEDVAQRFGVELEREAVVYP